MRLVGSANQNVAIEDTTKEQRAQALNTLLGNKGFTPEQRALMEKARATDNVTPLMKSKLFSDAERAAFSVMFEHGKTSVAEASRRARVEDAVNRKLGKLTEHERQVRERIASREQHAQRRRPKSLPGWRSRPRKTTTSKTSTGVWTGTAARCACT